MRISDWSSDVCSSDLVALFLLKRIKGFQRTIEFRVERWHGLFKFIFRNNGLRRRLRRRHLLRTRQSSRTCDPKKSECQPLDPAYRKRPALQNFARLNTHQVAVTHYRLTTNNPPRFRNSPTPETPPPPGLGRARYTAQPPTS